MVASRDSASSELKVRGERFACNKAFNVPVS